MPNIKLTDQLGIEIDVALSDDAALAKYIKELCPEKFSIKGPKEGTGTQVILSMD